MPCVLVLGRDGDAQQRAWVCIRTHEHDKNKATEVQTMIAFVNIVCKLFSKFLLSCCNATRDVSSGEGRCSE